MPELMIECVHCEHEVPLDHEFCPQCGQWLKCPECHERLPDPAKISAARDADDEDEDEDEDEEDEEDGPLEEEDNASGTSWVVISKTSQSITYGMAIHPRSSAPCDGGVLLRTVTRVETTNATCEAVMAQTYLPGVTITDFVTMTSKRKRG